ncbi:MAG: transcriptional regulator, family [Actinomycetia bacterium]|jgi:transcriptional regulator with XRE-family HTH domain|nr:transcriptional regulator, family [Actinomycetes bacterium]
MSASGEIDPKSSLWAWLARDLRFYREKHGLSGTQLGKIIGCVRSTVSNLEAGRYRLDDKQARALDKEWNTGGHFERLLWFAQTAHDPDWFRTYTQFEADA